MLIQKKNKFQNTKGSNIWSYNKETKKNAAHADQFLQIINLVCSSMLLIKMLLQYKNASSNKFNCCKNTIGKIRGRFVCAFTMCLLNLFPSIKTI